MKARWLSRKVGVRPGAAILALGVLIVGAAEAQIRLGSGDIAPLQILNRPEQSAEVVVEADGSFYLPKVGVVTMEGRTEEELQGELQNQYCILNRDVSDIKVSVKQFDSLTVVVLGEVRNPGAFGFKVTPSVWDALLRAGGANATADLSRVRVIRKNGSEEVSGFQVDISAILERTPLDSLPPLQESDIVIVPKLYFALNSK